MCVFKMVTRMYSLIWTHLTISVMMIVKLLKIFCNYCKVAILRGKKNPKTFETTNIFKHKFCDYITHLNTICNLEVAQQHIWKIKTKPAVTM